MNWPSLKLAECPKDGAKLSHGLLDDEYRCSNSLCDFSISDTRFDEIVKDMARPRSKRFTEDDNFAALNNLGHKIPSRDYSDRQPSV